MWEESGYKIYDYGVYIFGRLVWKNLSANLALK